ncbi:hypothetical protein J4G37_42555, partial [Microvirga sp. 3-52]|nr:hypothetical protein [Microvirga sp. 3-52]
MTVSESIFGVDFCNDFLAAPIRTKIQGYFVDFIGDIGPRTRDTCNEDIASNKESLLGCDFPPAANCQSPCFGWDLDALGYFLYLGSGYEATGMLELHKSDRNRGSFDFDRIRRGAYPAVTLDFPCFGPGYNPAGRVELHKPDHDHL